MREEIPLSNLVHIQFGVMTNDYHLILGPNKKKNHESVLYSYNGWGFAYVH